MTKLWFTSDTHFGQSSVLDNRPDFGSVEEMDETIIDNWNTVVGVEDVVMHLGDFTYLNNTNPRKYTDRLNGKIFLCIGNHDGEALRDVDLFEGTFFYNEITLGDTSIVVCHYPFAEWSGYWKGGWHLHGHLHGRCDVVTPVKKRVDVSTNIHNFTPITFEEVVAYEENR